MEATAINMDNDLVTFRIGIGDDNQPLDATVNIDFISIQKEINKIPSARIKILNGDTAAANFPQSDAATFIPGKKIQIALGYHSQDTLLFKGIIITHSNRANNYATETNIECKDEAVKMTIVPKNKHYNDVSDSDVAEQLISNYGLAADVDSTNIQYPDLVQYNTSDWDFMVSRMDRIGKIVLVNEGTVQIKKPDTDNNPALNIAYGNNILEFNTELDARQQINTVKVSSWDFQSQSIISTESQFNISNEEGNIAADDLASALNIDQLDLRSASWLSEEERQAIADARKMKNVLSKIKGSVKFEGYSDIHPGDMISLQGAGDRFNGPAFISAVKHEYADGNWITEVALGLPSEWFASKAAVAQNITAPGSAPANITTGLFSVLQGLQIGVVTDIVDPENEFRVKISLPAVNGDEEGIWARTAMPDAGDNRGFYFGPEISDEVIVGFINNDPTQPIILGMLHSSALPSPITPAADNNEKGLQTRSGIKLNFNDGDNAVKIETPAGKKITLSDNDGVVKLEDENSNTITFDSSGISIESASDLNIKASGTLSLQAAQISISGNSDLKIEGTSVSVNGSGVTEIKGGIVKIN